MAFKFIGKSLPRTEDNRLLRGLGRYVPDLVPAGAVHMVVVRSPHAAARILSIDTAAAEAMPGVHLVLTGEDPEIASLGTFTSRVRHKAPDGQPNFLPPFRMLARERALFVGDAVAIVCADTLAQARDAAEAVVVDWEPLPAITETARTTDPDAPQVWPEVPRNRCFVQEHGSKARVDEALAGAKHVVSLTYPVTRIIAAYMETRSSIGSYDAGRETYELIAGVQNPHYYREEIAERILKIEGNRLRVISPDVGGAFGAKESPQCENVLVLVAAKRIGRPVVWVADRSESFLADNHARDNYTTVTLGLNEHGDFLALKVELLGNIGAYVSYNGLHSMVNNLGGLSGVYRTPAIHACATGVFSHTAPTAPYRGAGRPEATFALERAIDLAAQRCGFDRVELRRRNLIAPEQMPYNTGFLFTYDSGEFGKNMDMAMELGDWAGFAARRTQSEARGRLRGISLTNAIEIAAGPAAGPNPESAEIVFDSGGAVTLKLGTHSHGQGHEITMAQVAADCLGVEPGEIRVLCGDTALVAHGIGTFGSRSAAALGLSLQKATERIVARGKRIAAVHFETAAADIVFEDGQFGVAGTDRRIGIRQVARLAHTLRHPDLEGEFGFAEKAVVAATKATFPNGCHICEVEIDPETGTCRIERYCVVDDCGRQINPMLVKGQIQGGVAQGVGQILLEHLRYDDTGQVVSGSFMDYAMPRADDLPSIPCAANEVLTDANPLGVKGAGEAGTVGALAAVVNAIVDALRPLGVEHIDMPATPERIWRAVQGGGRT